MSPQAREEFQAAVAACDRILNQKISRRDCGLCLNLRNEMRVLLGSNRETFSHEFTETFDYLLTHWPGGTGRNDFTVPAPGAGRDDYVAAYRAYYLSGFDLWRPDEEYGIARLKLTQWVRDVFAALAN